MTQTTAVGNDGSIAHGTALTPALRDQLRAVLAFDRDETYDVVAPFTGEVLGSLPVASQTDVEEAVRRARAAQAAWAATSWSQRKAVFLRYHDLVLQRQREVLDLIQLETGKARSHAYEEVADVAIVSRYYARSAEQHLKPVRRKGALPGLTLTVEHHHPKGVVGVVSPWNYPLSMSITDAIPALLAGNAVVLRPDQQTTYTALWAVQVLREAGLPADVLQVVTGPGSQLGPWLIHQVDYVMFTGSTATGRIVAKQAAERLIGCSLELGGKNAMVVLADADLDKAVDGAVRGCFASGGQLCISLERIYVERPAYDEFRRRFAEAVQGMRLSAGFDFSADMGSLASAKQLETVQRHVDDAIDNGATLVAGGKPRPDIGPWFFEPTVLADLPESATACRNETFGPVVALYPVASAEEAVARANDSEYGLNTSVWTRDARRGAELAARIKAGTANVNESYAAAWGSVDSPMGGMKSSGLGRRHGREGILKYTESQTVSVQRLVPLAPPPKMTSEKYADLMSTSLRLMRKLPWVK